MLSLIICWQIFAVFFLTRVQCLQSIRHYVPVAQDLSNLLEVLELLETNETLALNLAEAAFRVRTKNPKVSDDHWLGRFLMYIGVHIYIYIIYIIYICTIYIYGYRF